MKIKIWSVDVWHSWIILFSKNVKKDKEQKSGENEPLQHTHSLKEKENIVGVRSHAAAGLRNHANIESSLSQHHNFNFSIFAVEIELHETRLT